MVQKQVQNRLHAPLPCTLTVLRYLHFCEKCLPQWTHQPSKTKINVSRQDCVSTNVGYDVWSTARQTDCLNKPATVTLLSVMSPGMRFSAVSSLAVGDWLANVGRQSYLGKTACLPLLGLPVWRTRAGCVNARHHLQYFSTGATQNGCVLVTSSKCKQVVECCKDVLTLAAAAWAMSQ